MVEIIIVAFIAVTITAVFAVFAFSEAYDEGYRQGFRQARKDNESEVA